MAKLTLNDILGGYQTAQDYNDNNALIEAFADNTISRDGSAPNNMDADFDMNSFDVNNIKITRTERLFINGVEASITLGSVASLNDLTDVDTTGVTDGQVILYDDGTSTWIVGDAAASLVDLTDTTIAGPANRHGLMHDGTDWKNRLLVEADISNLGSYSLTGHGHVKADISDFAHTHPLADGATDVTATAAELNLLDLAGLTAGHALVADSPTTASWQAIAQGDVTKVGTPVNNQIGVWTGDGTLEGDEHLLWDETILTVDSDGATAVRIESGSTSDSRLLFYQTFNQRGTLIYDHSDQSMELSAVTGTVKLRPANTDIVEAHSAFGVTLHNGGIRFSERSATAQVAAATFGDFWVRDDSPTVPMFTDDDGTDWVINTGGDTASAFLLMGG